MPQRDTHKQSELRSGARHRAQDVPSYSDEVQKYLKRYVKRLGAASGRKRNMRTCAHPVILRHIKVIAPEGKAALTNTLMCMSCAASVYEKRCILACVSSFFALACTCESASHGKPSNHVAYFQALAGRRGTAQMVRRTRRGRQKRRAPRQCSTAIKYIVEIKAV